MAAHGGLWRGPSLKQLLHDGWAVGLGCPVQGAFPFYALGLDIRPASYEESDNLAAAIPRSHVKRSDLQALAVNDCPVVEQLADYLHMPFEGSAVERSPKLRDGIDVGSTIQ